jgi:hypothetical protein
MMVIMSNGSGSPECTQYGNPPAKPSGSMLNYNKMVEVCKKIRGQLLTFKDSNNQMRCACLLITPSSEPLPLVVWLQPSVALADSVYNTKFTVEASTGKLMGAKDGPVGYHLLLPAARLTKNFECIYIDCVTWDTWYRNFNRSDPKMNVDVQTIDFFLNHVLHKMSNLHVDPSRVFLSGWSNGGVA